MLVAAGDRADRIVSWAGITTSLDGQTWTTPVDPFNIRGKAWGVAYGEEKYVAIGDGGLVANSADLVTWTQDKIWFGNFQPLSICYKTNYAGNNGIFMAVGQNKFPSDQGPYRTNDEVAILLKNTTGDNWMWQQVYIHQETNSRFYSVRRLVDADIDIWVALGSSNRKPIGIYSLDNGFTWNPITFPNLADVMYAYDITYSNNRFWIAVNGLILNTDNLSTGTWDSSRTFVTTYGRPDFVNIAANPSGDIVAVGSGGIAYTTDQIGWELLTLPGYRPKSVTWFNDRWVVGAESNLTQYTHWTSTDAVNWTPAYCGVQIYGFTIV